MVSWRVQHHTLVAGYQGMTTYYHESTSGTAWAVAGEFTHPNKKVKLKWEVTPLTTVWHVLGAAAVSGL